MAERPKAAVLKTVGHASAPWVRILLPPPIFSPRKGRFQQKTVSGFKSQVSGEVRAGSLCRAAALSG